VQAPSFMFHVSYFTGPESTLESGCRCRMMPDARGLFKGTMRDAGVRCVVLLQAYGFGGILLRTERVTRMVIEQVLLPLPVPLPSSHWAWALPAWPACLLSD
jgi:hypothetical protein